MNDIDVEVLIVVAIRPEECMDVARAPRKQVTLMNGITHGPADLCGKVVARVSGNPESDRNGHFHLVQVGNVVHERPVVTCVHEPQPWAATQSDDDRMDDPVQAGRCRAEGLIEVVAAGDDGGVTCEVDGLGGGGNTRTGTDRSR